MIKRNILGQKKVPFWSSIKNLLVWAEIWYFRNPYVRTYKKSSFNKNVTLLKFQTLIANRLMKRQSYQLTTFGGKDPYGDSEGVLWLQGLHMVHCSYDSLWMGQIIHPD
ncbi:putative galactinol--sucrose galactosyltransferase 4 [Bienertia sinuspersici]